MRCGKGGRKTAGMEGESGVGTEAGEIEVKGPIGEGIVGWESRRDGLDSGGKLLVNVGVSPNRDSNHFEASGSKDKGEVRVLE